MRKFGVGDKVTPKADAYGVPKDTLGRVFEVTKVNPKNTKAKALDGGRGINFPQEILVAATDENVAAGEAARGSVFGRSVEPVRDEFFKPGEIVTLKRPWRDWTTETPLVVIADKGRKVNVVPLGGAAELGRYLRVPPTGLEKRSRGWLAALLIEVETLPES